MGGQSVSFEFRTEDPRLGRFFSVDPMTGMTPWETPYAFAGNSPIANIDYLGLNREDGQGRGQESRKADRQAMRAERKAEREERKDDKKGGGGAPILTKASDAMVATIHAAVEEAYNSQKTTSNDLPNYPSAAQDNSVNYGQQVNLNYGQDAITPETVWDVINVGMGVASLAGNILTGNYISALVDVTGLGYDFLASIVPVLPGGASSGIGLYRLANLANKTKSTIDDAAKLLRTKIGPGTVFTDAAGKLENSFKAIDKNGKVSEVLGAVKEILGLPIEHPKPNGDPLGHVKELQGVINSLSNSMTQINNVKRSNHGLSDIEINTLNEAYKDMTELQEKYSSILSTAKTWGK